MPSRSVCVITLILGSCLLHAENLQPSTAHIPGDLPDWSVTAPQTAKPSFQVPPAEILETKALQQGGRTITLNRIKPIRLPEPLAATPALDPNSPEVAARIAEMRARHPRAEVVSIGATVYRSQISGTRTLATFHAKGIETPVTFWSSADFSLLAGCSSYVGSDSKPRSLMMAWGSVDLDRMSASMASRGHTYHPPEIPPLPAGAATFSITSGNPTAESLAAIQSLHDLYNNEHARLLAAYQAREAAHLQRQAELAANPPQPKNIVFNYWRSDSSDQQPEGGDQ